MQATLNEKYCLLAISFIFSQFRKSRVILNLMKVITSLWQIFCLN